MFIDVHCHLDICKDIDSIIENCAKKKIGLVLTNGMNIEINRKTLELSEKYKIVKAAVGLYPTEALKLSDKEIDKEAEFIRKNKKKMVCVGEVGLDLKENLVLDRQREIFIKFIELAKELKLPLTVHSREAEEETIDTLLEYGAQKVIMHCFSGSLKLVRQIIASKWFLSIPASVKYNAHFQRIVQETPTIQLLCETDSPFLHPDRERDNSPEQVIESYKKIAELKKITLAECEKIIEVNFFKLFKQIS